MNQIEIIFKTDKLNQHQLELIPYWLEFIGYEGFDETAGELIAYISADKYNIEELQQFLLLNGLTADCFEERQLPERNWNEEWEKNFEPVSVDGQCYIRAPFHKSGPSHRIEIVIEPKMSFGTGHHATTMLMVKEMLETDLQNKKVFDAGCGTGILAILAEKLGAKNVMAIDIDEWSYTNAIENAQRNNCSKIQISLGDAGSLTGQLFDGILANINLNILKAGMSAYYNMLLPGGFLIMSGILETDIPDIRKESEKYNLEFKSSKVLNNWALISFRKR